MTEQALARARAGDEEAFRELTDPYQHELQLHIYRIVGSAQDAEDLLQETLLAAWRALEQFEGRASVRAWLYRNVGVGLKPNRLAPAGRLRHLGHPPVFRAAPARPPRIQRAVLVLRDVLGYRAGEVAEMLETSEASVNSLLRRARAAFESRLPATGRERAPLPNSKLERDIVGRFAETVENGDIDGMVALLTDDAWLTMPPLPHAYLGRDAIGAFLRGAGERRGAPMRLVPTRANGQPAFGGYLSEPETDVARAFSLFVLTLEGDHISAITWFADSGVFRQFGLPRMLR